ncbi:PGAM-domain-containing protein [Polyplosphaeria fusca]|uniref:PGAM-domain-containing protein n=1 Tax=Polyplosphaeria fusca TaxID=682080 RepID=A0A9P4QWM3_9PLEO|nr:PGAM-domain-containing protein [Polyplosphaeria fusca]
MPPKQVHLIRHAEGQHNLSIESHNIRDPSLTERGKQQCLELSNSIDSINNIQCIIASPLRRTLWTALRTFQQILRATPELKIIALPELQETSTLACDTGSPLELLKEEFAGEPIDWTYMQDDWTNKTSGRYSPRADLVANRARDARKFLQSKQEDEVAAVVHGGLLHFLTEDWADHARFCGTGWANCELRTYAFDMSTSQNIANATVVETSQSIARRVGHLNPLSIDEQLELQAVAQASWAKDGYITLPTSLLPQTEDEPKDTKLTVFPNGFTGAGSEFVEPYVQLGAKL